MTRIDYKHNNDENGPAQLTVREFQAAAFL